MKIASIVLLSLLTLLALFSGTTKVLLMPQEVEFFGRYGFTNPILIAFGSAQLIGGILMLLSRTRFAGAAIVASTFLASLVILLMDGNIPVSIVTAIATLLLVVIMKQSWRSGA